MDILLLDALIPEAMSWLEARHDVQYRPELADDPVALRQAAYKAQAIVFPRQTIVTRELLDFLPLLKAVGRLHAGRSVQVGRRWRQLGALHSAVGRPAPPRLVWGWQ